jgi:hypothetical protein
MHGICQFNTPPRQILQIPALFVPVFI